MIDRDQLPETPMHRRPPRPPPACAGGARTASPGGAVSRAHRGTGRPRGAGREPADRRPLVPQRPPAPAGGHRTGAPVRQPTLLEAHVRARVRALPNARLLDRATSSGWPPPRMVAASPGRGCCAGPTAAPRSCSAPTWWSTPAAVARAQRGWRRSATRPDAEQVRIGLGYATRTYRLPPDALDGDLAILDAATPQHPRTGASSRSRATAGC